jgi:hypothetical protein
MLPIFLVQIFLFGMIDLDIYNQVEKYIKKYNDEFLIELVNGYYLNQKSVICKDHNDLLSFGLAFLNFAANKYIIKEVNKFNLIIIGYST